MTAVAAAILGSIFLPALAEQPESHCAPLNGTWQRSLAAADHWGETDQILAVDAPSATMTNTRREYGHEADAVTTVAIFRAACRVTGVDTIELVLTPVEPTSAAPWVMAISHIKADSFITMEPEPAPHPPPPDWTPAQWAIVWKRIVP